METFKKQRRYIVFKLSDTTDFLDKTERDLLQSLEQKIHQARKEAEKPPLECVCVESEWPEYDEVWAMIAERVTKGESSLTKAIDEVNELKQKLAEANRKISNAYEQLDSANLEDVPYNVACALGYS